MEPNENQINIELSEEIAEGIYSNLAIITHSNSEFVLDFIRVMPGVPKAKVKSRIILTPEHAKRLLAALHDNIEKFEAVNGRIKINEEPNMFPPQNMISFSQPYPCALSPLRALRSLVRLKLCPPARKPPFPSSNLFIGTIFPRCLADSLLLSWYD